jgi:hypothetical protein
MSTCTESVVRLGSVAQNVSGDHAVPSQTGVKRFLYLSL